MMFFPDWVQVYRPYWSWPNVATREDRIPHEIDIVPPNCKGSSEEWPIVLDIVYLEDGKIHWDIAPIESRT